MDEVILHNGNSDYAKEVNKIFGLDRLISKLNSLPIEDREYWRNVIIVTLLHNTVKSKEETDKSLKTIQEALGRLKNDEW